jgi:PAS domain S-box-containing protein
LVQGLADYCGDALHRINVAGALLETEAKYRQIVENAAEGIFQTTPEGHYRSANPAMARILGYPDVETLLQSVTNVGRQVYARPERRAEFKQLLETHGSVLDFEVEFRRRDGSTVWVIQNARAVRDPGGRLLYYEGTVLDITERKQAEEQLRLLPRRITAAQEAERQRVARELHDGVNQILAAAKLRLRKVQENVDAIKPAAREMLARCADLLVQALEENRRIAHGLRPTELDELGLVEACRNFCRQVQLRTRLVLKFTSRGLTRRLPPGVELNLFRIVQEAVNNIEKHAQATSAEVRLALRGGTILLKIEDNGRGFEPKATRSSQKDGYGIGLTNLNNRAGSIGGTCKIESAPARGTIITVRVPLAAQLPAQPAQAAPVSTQHTA